MDGNGARGGGDARDPGLQPERTRLAWRRTTLTCTAVAVLAVKQALHAAGSPVAVAGTASIALLWVGFLAVAHRRIRALAAPRPVLLSARSALAAALVCAALAGLTLVVILASAER
ncbi:DUF202 domain-containing protein [Streptomyces sp. NRRL S-87]|uniref:DUF202 domain-containing protein n=1 Tax=Streptomyces sp. NRRL S-87 TaxID=1463920 RepID=UPI00068F42FE|nr:DUF202 domain-containing protein [Streptomyces sp. NRRL S-87]